MKWEIKKKWRQEDGFKIYLKWIGLEEVWWSKHGEIKDGLKHSFIKFYSSQKIFLQNATLFGNQTDY